MPYDGKLLAKAREQLEKLRAENEAEHQRRLDRVYTAVPEIDRIDRRMRAQMLEIARLTLKKSADIASQIAALRDENLDLQVRRAELLTEHGFSSEYLDEI